MKLRYRGKYSGDPATLPSREPPPGAVPFREPENMTRLAIVANAAALVVTLALLVGVVLRSGQRLPELLTMQVAVWCLASCLVLFPHELLHACCFQGEVFLYTNWKQGLLFVVGTEDMTKARFTVMSLLPNLVFGLLPYLAFWAFPGCVGLGVFGALSLGAGCGDYLNIWNALTQVPAGGLIYMHQEHTYWYLP